MLPQFSNAFDTSVPGLKAEFLPSVVACGHYYLGQRGCSSDRVGTVVLASAAAL